MLCVLPLKRFPPIIYTNRCVQTTSFCRLKFNTYAVWMCTQICTGNRDQKRRDSLRTFIYTREQYKENNLIFFCVKYIIGMGVCVHTFPVDSHFYRVFRLIYLFHFFLLPSLLLVDVAFSLEGVKHYRGKYCSIWKIKGRSFNCSQDAINRYGHQRTIHYTPPLV